MEQLINQIDTIAFSCIGKAEKKLDKIKELLLDWHHENSSK